MPFNIREIINEEKIVIYFQSIVSLSTGNIIGYESLLR